MNPRWWWKCRHVLAMILLSWATSGSACATASEADEPDTLVTCLQFGPWRMPSGPDIETVLIVPAEFDCADDPSTEQDLYAA